MLTVVEVKRAKVVVVWLWPFGNDVGGGNLVVVGGRGDRGCGDGGVVGVVVKGSDVVCGDLVVEVWLVQNNDRKRKMATSKSRSPVNTKNSL